MSALKGVVLAGGESKRFGEDKAMAHVRGERMIESAIRLLRELKISPLVVTQKGRDYAFLNCEITHDLFPQQGPLGGLYTACQLYPQATLLALSCDMPNLTPEVLQTLVSHHRPEYLATLFDLSKDYFQPFPGIYMGSLAERMAEALEKHQLSMQNFLRGITQLNLVATGYSEHVFENINYQKDLF